jgi:hypothetical protein
VRISDLNKMDANNPVLALSSQRRRSPPSDQVLACEAPQRTRAESQKPFP